MKFARRVPPILVVRERQNYRGLKIHKYLLKHKPN